MENKDQEISPFAQFVTFILLLAFMCFSFYCGITIYKGVIKQAIVEALQEVNSKPK